MNRLALALTLVLVAGCATPEFAPDAIVSSADGSEVAVRSWEFCGPAGDSYECLDSLPEDNLPVLSVASDGTWTIERPAGYRWEVRYRAVEPDDSSTVLTHETETGVRVVMMPEPGRYLVEIGGRTEETVGAWTFELVVEP